MSSFNEKIDEIEKLLIDGLNQVETYPEIYTLDGTHCYQFLDKVVNHVRRYEKNVIPYRCIVDRKLASGCINEPGKYGEGYILDIAERTVDRYLAAILSSPDGCISLIEDSIYGILIHIARDLLTPGHISNEKYKKVLTLVSHFEKIPIATAYLIITEENEIDLKLSNMYYGLFKHQANWVNFPAN